MNYLSNDFNKIIKKIEYTPYSKNIHYLRLKIKFSFIVENEFEKIYKYSE